MRKTLIPGLFFIILIVSCIFFAGCTTPASQTNISSTTVPGNPLIQNSTPGEAKTVTEANNEFAFELYRNLRNDPASRKSNLFFSPVSISTALAMTYEGARGKTSDEIESVFHFPRDDKIRRQQFSDINTAINTKDTSYSLSTANSLWTEKTYQLLPEYKQIVSTCYKGDATDLDFKNSPEDSRLTINEWVSSKTDGNIANLLSPGSIDPSTRLVITNAVFFNGFWKYPFFTTDTHSEKFTIAPGETTDVNMMEESNESINFGYNETDRLQILEMTYLNTTGRELSMLIILPKDGTGIRNGDEPIEPGLGNSSLASENLAAIEDTLDAKNVSDLRNALEPRNVDVLIPKFRIETQYGMNKILQNMGMPTAFTNQADFSGMDGTRNLFISDVVHKAYVEVDEKGTKAAAATAVNYAMNSAAYMPPTFVFRADHPFLIIIQDKESGNILFMGRITNPNA